ncbi:hypothetical protein Tco_0912015 [Tanacetum coccineum]
MTRGVTSFALQDTGMMELMDIFVHHDAFMVSDVKVRSAIRQLAYGYAPDVLDEYLQIGANNDLNALYRSNLFDDVLDDVVPECPFTVLEIDGMWSRYGVRTLEFRGYSSGGDMVVH